MNITITKLQQEKIILQLKNIIILGMEKSAWLVSDWFRPRFCHSANYHRYYCINSRDRAAHCWHGAP